MRLLGLIRFCIFILLYYLMTLQFITEIKAQEWHCAPAQTNTIIPNSTANLDLRENSVAVHPLKPNIVLSANNINYPGGVAAHISTD